MMRCSFVFLCACTSPSSFTFFCPSTFSLFDLLGQRGNYQNSLFLNSTWRKQQYSAVQSRLFGNASIIGLTYFTYFYQRTYDHIRSVTNIIFAFLLYLWFSIPDVLILWHDSIGIKVPGEIIFLNLCIICNKCCALFICCGDFQTDMRGILYANYNNMFFLRCYMFYV